METYCRDRRLMRSTNGGVGLVHAGAQVRDVIAVVLGCNTALTLRHVADNRFKLVGDAYYDGMMHGEALLGPIPADVEMLYSSGNTNFLTVATCFYNKSTGVVEMEDPRLPDLPPTWDRVYAQNSSIPRFKHRSTGEIRDLSHDPRLDVAFLEKMGVTLQDFELI